MMEFYKDDFDEAELKMQLDTLSSNFPADCEVNLEFLLTYFKGLSESQKVLLSQIVKLASLLCYLPATNAVSNDLSVLYVA